MFKCKHKNIIKKYKREPRHDGIVLISYEYCDKCKTLLRGGVSYLKPTIEAIVKSATHLSKVAVVRNPNKKRAEKSRKIKKVDKVQPVKETINENIEETVAETVVETPSKKSYFKRRAEKKQAGEESTVFLRETKESKRKKRR